MCVNVQLEISTSIQKRASQKGSRIHKEKKQYNDEPIAVKEAIINLSREMRKAYPEINEELPL